MLFKISFKGNVMCILETRNLKYLSKISYPDLRIESDKITFIKGASGCGKSSLLKLFNMTVTPDEGEIFYNGKPIESYEPTLLRKEILLVGQTVFLFDLTVKENFDQFFNYRKQQTISKQMIEKYLKICGLDIDINQSCTVLSGGEKQRVFLTICLSLNPKILMLDEPTASLDLKMRNKVMYGILEYCKENKITAIVVSHDEELISLFASDIIKLDGDFCNE